MAPDIKSLSVDELKTVIHNHEEKGKTRELRYLEAIAELDSRQSPGLDLHTTVHALIDAAQKQNFISYGDLAEANGSDWQKVRRLMPKHLDSVLSYCHQRELPYLTAIVVSKPNLQTGKFDADNLKGFIKCMRRLKLVIVDEEKFAKEEQGRVFKWGRLQSEQTKS